MRTPTLKMAVAAGALLASAGVAQAWVPAAGDAGDKALFGQLIDIYKQQAKFVACVVKAAVKCEGAGTDPAVRECTFSPVAGPGMAAALAACESKVDYAKKSATSSPYWDYFGMGCPGDSDSTAAGNQQYVDLDAWQAARSSTYTQLDALGTLSSVLGVAAGYDVKTQGKNTGELSKYGQAVFKCMGACEGDTKNSKGNGGTTDSTTQCSFKAADTPDAAQAECRDAAKAKMESKLGPNGGTYAALIPLINNALTDAANTTWNNTEGCEP